MPGSKQWRQLLLVVVLASLVSLSMVLAGWFDVGQLNMLRYDGALKSWQPPVTVSNLGWATFLVLTPSLAFVTRMMNRSDGATAYSLVVLCGLVALTETFTWTGEPDQTAEALYVIPYAFLLVLLGWKLWNGDTAILQQKVWVVFALIGILAWGLGRRLEALAWAANVPLYPDAHLYRYLAQTMSSPYDTGYREPLWIWVAKGWFWLVGDSYLSLRVLTVVLSVLLVGLAYKVFYDYTGRVSIGLLVALLLSQHDYLINLSVQGLREEAYTILILCVVYVIFVQDMRLSLRGQVLALAVLGASIVLLRLNGLVCVIPLLLIWVWKRCGWKDPMGYMRLAVIAVFIAAVVAPHLIHNERIYGDPWYSLNRHAVAARDIEFVIVKGVGCAGCPTAEELQKGFTGSPVTTFEYLFRLHGVGAFATGLAEGYRDLFVRPTQPFWDLIGKQLPFVAYGFFLLGLVVVLYSPYRVMLFVIALLANVIPFFLVFRILDLRLGIHLAPFVLFILACGLVQCLAWGCQLLERVMPNSAPLK